MYIMASEPISTAYLINPSSHSNVSICVSIVARQRLRKNVTAATNTHAKIEELLGASLFYSVRVASKERRRSVLARTSYLYVKSGGTHSYHCALSI
jgi:hypothetical protein